MSEEGEDGKPTKGKKSTKMAITVQNLQRQCAKARQRPSRAARPA